jgi:hypothetical protein
MVIVLTKKAQSRVEADYGASGTVVESDLRRSSLTPKGNERWGVRSDDLDDRPGCTEVRIVIETTSL